MRWLVLELTILQWGIPMNSSPSPALPMAITSSLHLVGRPHIWQTQYHMLRSHFPPPRTQYTLNFVCNQTSTVGSETQRVGCYIGYPQTHAQASIHPLS